MKKHQWLYELIIYLLALLFLYTAFSKLIDMRHFFRAIHNQPFPRSVDPVLTVGVPLIEIIAGISLLRIKLRKFGLYLSMILMLAFTIYVGLAVFHVFKRVPCGCAGVFQAMSWPTHLIFNLLFLGMAIAGLIIESKEANSKSSALKKAAI
ncbi:Methylamine utilisation protein MauE [Mucilaginibacter pineti]|uniref:Methylamine utilisation protein MauE n=1 Tax=Mucilaginibacter pineti TaxID=1391627 RepID=A0A1G7JP40_9SPHI|nr:MauE/DoxX family redox-associated membrane protein [Mucilaginibacter pineti]SDF26683.1 Methylamine utilisation protein MauE [Mucilaginibacter pineti]